MPDPIVCPVCQKPKSPSLILCRTCWEQFGGTIDKWPEWLRFLINDEYRWLYDEQQAAQYEVPLDEYEPDEDEELDCDLDGPLLTRPRSELAGSDSGFGLPYAPYPDEKTNRQYRRANGIPARKPPKPGLSTVKRYDAHHPNLPEGWWEAGRWVKPTPTLGEIAKEA